MKTRKILAVVFVAYLLVCATLFVSCQVNFVDAYTVTFKQDGQKDLKIDVVKGEEFGEVPTPVAVEGYTIVWDVTDFSEINGDITVTAVYTIITFTVTFNSDGGSEVAAQIIDYGSSATEPVTAKEGYTFSEWQLSGEAYDFDTAVKADITLKAKWIANTDIPYTVIHYQQNILDDEYSKVNADTQNLSGTVNELTSAAAKEYVGFTAKSFEQATIVADGSTVIKIYYDRNTFTVVWKDEDGTTLETDECVRYGATPIFDGDTPEKADTVQYNYTFKAWNPALIKVTADAEYTATYSEVVINYDVAFNCNGGSLAETQSVAYGSTATAPATTKAGYTLSKWQLDGVDFDFSTAIVGEITLDAVWTANTDTAYKVDVYAENLDGTYSYLSTIDRTGTTDTTATLGNSELALIPAGFEFDGANANNVVSGNIAGDGSLVLKVYIKRIVYTVTFNDESDVLVDTKTVKYGGAVELPDVPDKIGYYGVWTIGENILSSGTAYTYTENKTSEPLYCDCADISFEEGVVYGVLSSGQISGRSIYPYSDGTITALSNGGNYALKLVPNNYWPAVAIDGTYLTAGDVVTLDLFLYYNGDRVTHNIGISNGVTSSGLGYVSTGVWTSIILTATETGTNITSFYFNFPDGIAGCYNNYTIFVDNVKRYTLDNENITFEESIIYGVTNGQSSTGIYGYSANTITALEGGGNYALKVTPNNMWPTLLIAAANATAGDIYSIDAFIADATDASLYIEGSGVTFNNGNGFYSTNTWLKLYFTVSTTGTAGGLMFNYDLGGKSYADSVIYIDNIQKVTLDNGNITFEESIIYGVTNGQSSTGIYGYSANIITALEGGGNYALKLTPNNMWPTLLIAAANATAGDIYSIDAYIADATDASLYIEGSGVTFNNGNGFYSTNTWLKLYFTVSTTGTAGGFMFNYDLGGKSFADSVIYVDNIQKVTLDEENITFEEGIVYGVLSSGQVSSRTIYAYSDNAITALTGGENYALKVVPSNYWPAIVIDGNLLTAGDSVTFDLFLAYSGESAAHNIGISNAQTSAGLNYVATGVWSSIILTAPTTGTDISNFYFNFPDGISGSYNSYTIYVDNIVITHAA